MLHNYRKKIKYTLCMSAAVLLFISGCGREEKVDYQIDGIEESAPTQESAGRSGLIQFEGAELWQDTFEVPGSGDLEVNARIIVPNQNPSVVEVREPEFDASYKKTIANALFDEVYYGDYAHLPRKDLEKLSAMGQDGDLALTLEFFSEEAFEQEWQDFWDALDHMEDAADIYTPAEEYAGYKYIGAYEGELYSLSFLEDSGENSRRRRKQILVKRTDFDQLYPEKLLEKENLQYEPWSLGEWVENKCLLSREDAEEEAKAFVGKLGLDYSSASTIFPLLWGNEPDALSLSGQTEGTDWEVNGYVFTFDLGVDNISFVDYGIETDYFNFWIQPEEAELQYSMQACLQIYVTDQGVICAKANNPLEIVGIKEDVELLPLDTIKSLLKKEAQEQSEAYHFNTYITNGFDEMELLYFRIRDREHPGNYSYVPAWRLASITRDSQGNLMQIYNQILINAIDGSTIHFLDET